jgi:protein TonB
VLPIGAGANAGIEKTRAGGRKEDDEEEIVARLDALITEDPQPLNQALAESTTKDESPRSSEESIADLPQELSEELIAELEEAPELVVEAAGEPAAGRSREAAIEEAGAATEAEPLEGSDRVAEVEEEQKLETSDDVEVVEEEKKLDESDGVELDDEEPEIQIVANQQEVEEPTSKSATGATAATSLSDAPQLQTSRVLAEAEKTATTEAAQAVTGVESIKAEQVEPSPHGGSRKWVWISVAAAAVVVIGVAVVLALVLGPGEAAPAESVAQLTPAAAKPVVQKPVKRLDPQAYLMGPPEPTRAEPPAAERDVARPTTTKVESGATRPLAATKANPSPRTAEVKPTPQPAVKPPADKRVSRSERTVEQKGQAGVAGTTATVAAATEQDAVETTKPPAQGDAPATPVVERSVAEIPEEGSSEGFVQSPAELAAEKPTETSDAPITDDLDPQQLQPSETRAAATPEAATPEPDPVRPTIRRGSLVDISEVDSGPTAVKKAPPKYPLAARSLRLEGTVTLRVLVDESGKVAAVEPVPGRSAEVLVNAAARAARGWTYRAATKDGVPVKVWLTERVSFKR